MSERTNRRPPVPYQVMTAEDIRQPGRLCTFLRPAQDNDTILIQITAPGDFAIDAGTLRVIAEILSKSPSAKQII